jgi:hypothetical protein
MRQNAVVAWLAKVLTDSRVSRWRLSHDTKGLSIWGHGVKRRVCQKPLTILLLVHTEQAAPKVEKKELLNQDAMEKLLT